MLGFTKQNNTRVGGESLIGVLNFNRAVEIGLEPIALRSTHSVVFSVFEAVVSTR